MQAHIFFNSQGDESGFYASLSIDGAEVDVTGPWDDKGDCEAAAERAITLFGRTELEGVKS